MTKIGYEREMIRIEEEKLEALKSIERGIYEAFHNGGLLSSMTDVTNSLQDISIAIGELKEGEK